MRELELLSVVALLENVADHGLLRGQVGTVVERLAPGLYEVEFSDGPVWGQSPNFPMPMSSSGRATAGCARPRTVGRPA